MKYKFILALAFIMLALHLIAQTTEVYPANWWVGMKMNKVQLLIHDSTGLASDKVSVSVNYPGIKLLKVTKTESRNYVFADIEISAAAKPGVDTIVINNPVLNEKRSVKFELKARRAGRGTEFAKGVNASDFVYLVMPDRFVNGDPANDKIPEYLDAVCDRSNPSAHHGGDIAGVTSKLDYLKNMGVTTVWMCPVTENNMPWKEEPAGAISGYHGYWITNHYKIDKRYGGETAYKQLTTEAHNRGMKIIQDAVYNHVGSEHFLFKDKPFKDMFNLWPTYTGSNHREEVFYDPYQTAADKKLMTEGWFTPHLPDVNVRNPYMATFLIQNDIWCTEEFGVDGWRVDTYKYCDEAFLNRINNALLAEYPTITVFGEAWCSTVTASAYFARNNMNVAFKHNLQGVTDFPMQGAMVASANDRYGWNDGVNKLYSVLSQDILYQQPLRNCIFLDNHDMDRFVTMIGGDMAKFKMGCTLLLTQRGIPQMYYGTEIFMRNDDVKGDGKKRNDFPGGFAGDKADKFTTEGRSAAENEAFEYVKALANFRKTCSAIGSGKTMQFQPKDGVYVYFRYNSNQTVMVVLNTNEKTANINTDRFTERINGFTAGRNVVDGSQVSLKGSIEVPAKTSMVLMLK